MILKEIQTQQKQARLMKHKFKATVLTTLLAEVSIVGKNQQRETTNEEAIGVIAKFLNNLKETFKLFTNTELDEFANSEFDTSISTEKMSKMLDMKEESNIYKSFLPIQKTKSELRGILHIYLDNNTGADIGMIMGYFNKNFKGLYDGKMLSELVKGALT